MGLGFVVLLFLFLCALPLLVENIRLRLTDLDRRRGPGHFADLPKGKTFYQWMGPEDGQIVVCIHGLTTPSYVWGPVAAHLAQQNYRVLLYDLYGRGLSDRPEGRQDSWFFIRQLDALLNDQKIDQAFVLMGYSMGGAIAAAYAAHRAERLKKLVMIAPAGMGHNLGPLASVAERAGLLGRWLTVLFFPLQLRTALNKERGKAYAIPDMIDKQSAETQWQGFAPAVWASVSGLLQEDLSDHHRKIAESEVPALAVWANKDDTIPISGKARMEFWNPKAQHVVIENKDHALVYDDVDRVTDVLDSFL